MVDLESAERLQRLLVEMGTSGWERESVLAVPDPALAPTPVVPAEERRKQERVNKELRVILISGNSTFRCATCDVSKGGVRLKAAVPPAFCEKTCVAYLSQQGAQENLEIQVKVIADSNGVSRLQFVQPQEQELSLLNQWME